MTRVPQLLPRPLIAELSTGRYTPGEEWVWRDAKTGLCTVVTVRPYDGASVPRLLWWIWPPARNLYVWMIHDAAVMQHGWRKANGIARRAAALYAETPADGWIMDRMFDVLDRNVGRNWVRRLLWRLVKR